MNPELDSRLYPILRQRQSRRSFRWDRRSGGVALYPDEIAFFSAPRRRPLPQTAFLPQLSAGLAKVAEVDVLGRWKWEELGKARVKVAGGVLSVSLQPVLSNQWRTMKIDATEGKHVVQFLGQRLGARCEGAHEALPQLAMVQEGGFKFGRVVAVLLLVFSLAVIALGIFREMASPRDELGLLPTIGLSYGSVGALLSGAYLFNEWLSNRTRHPRTTPREPWRSRTLGMCCGLLGAALVAGAYLYSDDIAKWIFAGHFRLTSGELGSAQLAGNIMLWSGAFLLFIGYRLRLPGGLKSLSGDSRPPVIYLRSFADDGHHNLNPRGFLALVMGLRVMEFFERILGPLANLWPYRLFRLCIGKAQDTAEEQLSMPFRKLGPFVAIGRPGERLATGGAARLYVGDDRWQETVQDLLHRSLAIILQPAETEGIWWEIQKCREELLPQKLLLSLVNFENRQQAFDEFRLRFEDLLGHRMPRSTAGCQFMRFADNWEPALIPPVYRSPLVWPVSGCALNVAGTLHEFLRGIAPQSAGEAPKPLAWLRGGLARFTAFIFWIALPVAGLFLFGQVKAIRTALADARAPRTKKFVDENNGYVWNLGEGWKQSSSSVGFWRHTYVSKSQMVAAMVGARHYPSGSEHDLKAIEATGFEEWSQNFREPPLITSRKAITFNEGEVNEIEFKIVVKSQADLRSDQMDRALDAMFPEPGKVPAKRPQRLLEPLDENERKEQTMAGLMRIYSGPSGQYATVAWAPAAMLEKPFVGNGVLHYVLDGFSVAPAPPKVAEARLTSLADVLTRATEPHRDGAGMWSFDLSPGWVEWVWDPGVTYDFRGENRARFFIIPKDKFAKGTDLEPSVPDMLGGLVSEADLHAHLSNIEWVPEQWNTVRGVAVRDDHKVHWELRLFPALPQSFLIGGAWEDYNDGHDDTYARLVTQALHSFTFKPQAGKVITGKKRGYTITVPPGWAQDDDGAEKANVDRLCYSDANWVRSSGVLVEVSPPVKGSALRQDAVHIYADGWSETGRELLNDPKATVEVVEATSRTINGRQWITMTVNLTSSGQDQYRLKVGYNLNDQATYMIRTFAQLPSKVEDDFYQSKIIESIRLPGNERDLPFEAEAPVKKTRGRR